MARGWESKSVEDQIAATQAEQESRRQPVLSAADLERRARRDGLRLARARAVHELDTARNARHREMLERAIQHLDDQLQALDSATGTTAAG